ncbi:CaiB/BaiF CoA-transferase family protein [Bordetella sp. BOR01]|uniref:CaiB/BaiF CoA transferase family protein n=1 Tax=Bordetella sp. BOR01 TaxID=2854779 RepID=UPI001C488071|nr:CoA transferase [Bordetella sp. BOR01]MBV7483140.1 CoA transferase [Bordetella sp. BOR01]
MTQAAIKNRNGLPTKQFDASVRGPLHGVRVVDLSRLVAGNMLTLQLADFGADVIKVEPRTGDTLRAFQADGIETFWKVYARNKRSVCLDFRHPEAMGIIKQMAASADVIVESFRPGVLEEIGLGPDVLHAINKKLVVVRISGWGQTGPYRRKPGFGTLVEGYSGFAAMNGFSDREPVLPPFFLGDMAAGLYGANATMIALWNSRVNGGNGQVVDLSLFEPIVSLLGPQAASYAITGKVKPRTGSRSSTTAPRNTYRTQDGQWVCVSTSTASMSARLFKTIGREDVTTNPRYATVADRLKHVEEVDAIVGDFVGRHSLEDNLRIFEAADVTVGPVFDASHLMTDQYVIERESLVQLPDEDIGLMPMHNVVPRLSGTPGTFRRRAPHKGEHSAECLISVVGETRFEQLVESGAIFQRPDPASADADDLALATTGR